MTSLDDDLQALSDTQLLRYSRHILLEQFGVEAQLAFARARALIVGAGGLGTPAALYLAAAGVGHLTIADPDRVDLTNLQRQILYSTHDVGSVKVQAAKRALFDLNPEVEIEAIEQRLEGVHLDQLVSAADVILDCSDNFVTRHALNRACVAHGKPLISGAAIRFDGQISVFDLRDGQAPCYHCLFPEGHDVEEVNCATMGVFAPLTGIIGAMQAAEALKCIVNIRGTLSGRLLLLDALSMQWHSIAITRDPQCDICRERPVLDA